jgi:hypothetical protein
MVQRESNKRTDFADTARFPGKSDLEMPRGRGETLPGGNIATIFRMVTQRFLNGGS